jgi:hypothetical protein
MDNTADNTKRALINIITKKVVDLQEFAPLLRKTMNIQTQSLNEAINHLEALVAEIYNGEVRE